MEIAGRTYGIGQIIAFLVLVIAVIAGGFGFTLSPLMVLALIGGLALALLL